MTFVTIAFLIVAGSLSFWAGVSTKSREQKRLTMSVVVMLLLLFGVSALDRFNPELKLGFDFGSVFLYFLAFGMMVPRLIANIVNQNRLESPAIFIRRKINSVQWILTLLFYAYVTIMIMQPNRIRVSDGMPIYDEDYFRSRIGSLFFLIPSAIFMVIAMLQRTTFCSNGLFHNGLLFDWSDFKSYSWKNEWLEMEKHSVKDRIQLSIPMENRQAVKELLRVKFQESSSEQNEV